MAFKINYPVGGSKTLGCGGIRKTAKRSRTEQRESDSDSSVGTVEENTTKVVTPWPQYVVLDSEGPEGLKGVSVFAIAKWVKGVHSTIQPKPIRQGRSWLLFCPTEKTSTLLLRRNGDELLGKSLKITPHRSMNSCKGVIRCAELNSAKIEEIKEVLIDQGVSEVQRVERREGERRIPTGTYFLTFNRPKLPEEIVVLDFLKIKVKQFIPAPMRCFKCQRFGHTSQRCRQEAKVCHKCAKVHEDECVDGPKCVNCGGRHASSSKECSKYKIELEILKVKVGKNVSFREAKAEVNALANTPSYASKLALGINVQRQTSREKSSQTPGCLPEDIRKQAIAEGNRLRKQFAKGKEVFFFTSETQTGRATPAAGPAKPAKPSPSQGRKKQIKSKEPAPSQRKGALRMQFTHKNKKGSKPPVAQAPAPKPSLKVGKAAAGGNDPSSPTPRDRDSGSEAGSERSEDGFMKVGRRSRRDGISPSPPGSVCLDETGGEEEVSTHNYFDALSQVEMEHAPCIVDCGKLVSSNPSPDD